MRRTNPLWGSVSILIGVVIAILALLRGPWEVAALIVTFALWGLGWYGPSSSLPGGQTGSTGAMSVSSTDSR